MKDIYLKKYKRLGIACNYPKVLKAFNMWINDDEKSAQTMNILVAKIGEIIWEAVEKQDL